jgi:pimeloyl-ACP methyl ester carboxylesterase
MARDLENFLAHLALERPLVVGHSMGALTVWEHIRTFGTARFGRLCFVDQSPRLVTDGTWRHGIYGDFDAARSEDFIAQLRADFPEGVLRLAAYGLNDRARRKYEEDSRGWRLAREALRKLPPAPLIAAWESLTAADYRDVLPAIDVPTLLVHGGASNFYTLPTARYVRDAIPGARLLVFDDADHSPHLCAPDRFVRDLLVFAGDATPQPR